MPARVVALLRRREGHSPRPWRFGREDEREDTPDGAGCGGGCWTHTRNLGISLVGLIGGNREQAAPTTPPRAVNGATLHTVFIHHATPENISRNSTYLDGPPTDGNPNVVLVVTQNWNPGGSDGKYNNHPIGVWYDRDRSKIGRASCRERV